MGENFLQNVLGFYGEENSLSVGNLEKFLQLVTSRRAAAVEDEGNPLKNAEVKMRMCPVSDIMLPFHFTVSLL